MFIRQHETSYSKESFLHKLVSVYHKFYDICNVEITTLYIIDVM